MVSHSEASPAIYERGGVCLSPSLKKKTSCQEVWRSESAAERWAGEGGGVFADRLLVRPRPTPTPSLWCLCAFVNEEILVPGWDIAVSWADSALLSALGPSDAHTGILPSHWAAGRRLLLAPSEGPGSATHSLDPPEIVTELTQMWDIHGKVHHKPTSKVQVLCCCDID